MNTAFRATMLAGVSLCALFAAGPAPAQQSANERVYRQEALAHARAVTTAWRRLESYILDGSAGTFDPYGTSVSGWSGPVPPSASGWLADWTLRGVRARYCEDTLLVYLAPERLGRNRATAWPPAQTPPKEHGDDTEFTPVARHCIDSVGRSHGK